MKHKNIFCISNWAKPDQNWVNENIEKFLVNPNYIKTGYSGLKIPAKNMYSYLKARFGEPNIDIEKLDKSINFSDYLKIYRIFPSSFYWSFLVQNKDEILIFWGNRNTCIFCCTTEEITESDYETLISLLHEEFIRLASNKREVEKELTPMTFIINPYKRLFNIIGNLVEAIKEIDPIQPSPLKKDYSKNELKYFIRHYNMWVEDMDELINLCIEVRMLIPVMCECLVNLIIFIQARKQKITNKQEYEKIIREGIIDRLRHLHMNCFGINLHIDFESWPVINFLSMMNRRNDFLHGNIRPKHLKYDKIHLDNNVFVDFNDYEFFENLTANYDKMAEKDQVLKDYKIAEEFREYILSTIDTKYRTNIKGCLDTRVLGTSLGLGGTLLLNVPDENLYIS